ncbi:MAG: hypothetical protein IJ642_09480 [Oscillospiraceae bacterium]|nr:hypothetical protein [Oscillospiraceae bacterium]
MSTREIAYSMIDHLDEEQLNALIVILRGMTKEEPPKKKKSAASLCGIFHDVANPDLIPLEKTAWEQAAVEKHIRFLEEMNSENS